MGATALKQREAVETQIKAGLAELASPQAKPRTTADAGRADASARTVAEHRPTPVKSEIGDSLAFRAAGAYASASPAVAKADGPSKAERSAAARIAGYQGDACGECGNFTLVRNGTCLKCDTCGSTTGCS